MNNINKFFNLYKINNKVGLCNENKRLCACGNELNEIDKSCSKCGTLIKKSALLNVNKNSYLAKRYETEKNGGIVSFKYYQLLSNGFELYESEVFDFSIDTINAEVNISNSKIFKTIDSNDNFNDFLNSYFKGFKEFVYKCLGEFNYSMAVSNFGSLTDSQLSNYMNIYLNYKVLIPYIRGYKIHYYGKKFNLKKYYPDTDFNDNEEVKKTKLNLNLLLSWDIKNEKYIESIIEISNTQPESIQRTLSDILYNMLSDKRQSETYNNTIESFSLLYNHEIDIDNFIRIYNNSRDNYFNTIAEFRKLYKKFISKTIDWSKIDKIDRKIIGVLKTKNDLKKEMQISPKQINEVFELLEKDPLSALVYFNENNIKDK